MQKWMVIAVGNHMEHLLQLIDAVRCHDARILIQKVGQPAQYTEKKGTECRMLLIKGKQRCCRIIIRKQQGIHTIFVTGEGKEQKHQIVKQNQKTDQNCSNNADAEPRTGEIFYIIGVVHYHIEC